MVIGVIGAITGLAAAMLGSRIIEAQLWGVTAFDPHIYLTATSALLFVVLIATALPARVATQVAPTDALRLE